MKISKETAFIGVKGFCMGMADVVPGVSGGTVALVLGIYDKLIESISSVNKEFVKLIVKGEIKEALGHINISFLIPLFIGILTAIVSIAKLMHFLMKNYSVYTWSLFFGLIFASIIFLAKQIPDLKKLGHLGFIGAGSFVGYAVVSLIPVETPNTTLMVFLAGCIGIVAMILPGISGSFILLILGKYEYIMSAVKSITSFKLESLTVAISFGLGCVVGLLSFSKLLNYLLKHYHNQMMCVLVGFMIGSMKKIWPWKEILEQKVINGKVKVLKDAVSYPQSFGMEEIFAFGLMIFGVILVFSIEAKTKK
jgi:putative membrane protein